MVTVTHGTVVCGYEGPQSSRLNMVNPSTVKNRCLEIFLMFGWFLRDYFSACLLLRYLFCEKGDIQCFLIVLLSAVVPLK